jgi:7-cyano-7-deazaguanine synthase
VSAALAAKEGYELYFLTVDYGQKTAERELACARALAEALGATQIKILTLDWLKDLVESGLLDTRVHLAPQNEDLEYVPFRNTLLLSIAVAWAETLRANCVFIGSTGADRICPDNSPEYMQAFQQIICLGTKIKTDIELCAPLVMYDKTTVVRLGRQLGVPYECTWSCQNSTEIACGECSNCRARLRAFESCGLIDPLSPSPEKASLGEMSLQTRRRS